MERLDLANELPQCYGQVLAEARKYTTTEDEAWELTQKVICNAIEAIADGKFDEAHESDACICTWVTARVRGTWHSDHRTRTRRESKLSQVPVAEGCHDEKLLALEQREEYEKLQIRAESLRANGALTGTGFRLISKLLDMLSQGYSSKEAKRAVAEQHGNRSYVWSTRLREEPDVIASLLGDAYEAYEQYLNKEAYERVTIIIEKSRGSISEALYVRASNLFKQLKERASLECRELPALAQELQKHIDESSGTLDAFLEGICREYDAPRELDSTTDFDIAENDTELRIRCELTARRETQ